MATNYPSALDSLTNPISTDLLNSATVPHASQHANANDAIEAIEATLGTNPQGSSATVKDRFGTVAALASPNAFTVGGQSITSAAVDGVPLSIKGASGQTADLQTWLDSNNAASAHISSDGSLFVGEESTVNLIPNPSFEVNMSYTGSNSTTSITRDSTYSAHGSYSCKIVCSGGANAGIYPQSTSGTRLSVTGGQNYTFSTYVRDGDTGLPVRNVFEWYTSAGAFISDSTGDSTTMSTTKWIRIINTFTAPANAAFITVTTYLVGTAAAGKIFYVDGLQLEAKNYATSYIDGSLPGGVWSGTSGLSTSSRTALSVDRTDTGLTVGNNATFNAMTQVNAQGPSSIMFTLKRALNHIADQMQFKTSINAILSGFNALAQFFTGSTSSPSYSVGGATTATSGDGVTATITTTTATNLAVGDLIVVNTIEPVGYRTTGAVVTAVSNTSPFTVSYANTTTGSQTVAGTVRTTAQVSITARSNATKGLIVKASSGQTANLQEWQDSAGNALSSITPSGNAFFPTSQSSNFITTNNEFGAFPLNGGATIQMKKSSASTTAGTTDFARLCIVDGTTAGTLKLVIRAGTGGAQTTILDNIPQS